MEFMFAWENEGDHYSFEDSDRFEDESLSDLSEPESLCNNWRGWKKPNASGAALPNAVNQLANLSISSQETASRGELIG